MGGMGFDRGVSKTIVGWGVSPHYKKPWAQPPMFSNPVWNPDPEEAVYFLQLSSQKFVVLILSISEGWKAELALTIKPFSMGM